MSEDFDLADLAERLDALTGESDATAWRRGWLLADVEREHGRKVAALIAHGERMLKLSQLRSEKRVAAVFPQVMFDLSWSHHREVAALAKHNFEDACDALEHAAANGLTVSAFSLWIKSKYGRDARGRKEHKVAEPDLTMTEAEYLRCSLAASCPFLAGVHLDEAANAALDAIHQWQDKHESAAREAA